MHSSTSSAAPGRDLSAINAARELYQTYLRVHESKALEPLGVVLHRTSYRGKLLFREAPVLLPEEHFVSFQQLKGSV